MTRSGRAWRWVLLRPSHRRAPARHVQPDEIVNWRLGRLSSAGTAQTERAF